MSPHLNYQIARARQQEIASHAINSHHGDAMRRTGNRHRSVRHRLAQVVTALAVCGAAGTVVAVSDAHPNQRPVRQHISAQQMGREMRALEAKGYVPTACTVNGTLMRNYRTGQSVTVEL
jgi:hypothetical protein